MILNGLGTILLTSTKKQGRFILLFLFLFFSFLGLVDPDVLKWKVVHKTVEEAGYKTKGRLIFIIYLIQPNISKISTFQHLINIKISDEIFHILSFTLSL